MSFNAFISYSHGADGRLAPAVQRGLHGIAKPWYRLRTMRVFRDQTNLGANPGLWSSIEAALSDSEFFLFMASPTAARSPWVQKEINWWLTNRSPQTFLIVLTDGQISWDEALVDFDWNATTALPTRLSKAFSEEPLYTDLRWARESEHLSTRHSQFRAAILELAATLLKRPKDDLDSDDVRQYRRTRRIAWSGVAALAALFVAAIFAAVLATQQRNLAVSRALGASAEAVLPTSPELALLLAQEALRVKADDQAEYVLRKVVARNPLRTIHHAQSGKTVIADFAGGRGFVIAAEPGAHPTVWSAADGRRVADLPFEAGDRIVLSSPGYGALVALEAGENTFSVYDTQSWKALAKLPGKGPRFSDKGNLLAATEGTRIHLWGVPSLQRWRSSVQIPEGYSLRDISADGQLLLAVEGDGFEPGAGLVLSAESGQTLAKLPKQVYFDSRGFSPDGTLILGVSIPDGNFSLWESRTGTKKSSLKGETGWVEHAAFSPDGQLLVTGSRDGVLRLWSTKTGESEGELLIHSNRIRKLLFSRDGKIILSASVDGTACLWDAESRRCLVTLGGMGDDVWDANIASDSVHFLTTHLDGSVRLWNRDVWYPTGVLVGDNAIISSDGSLVLSSSAKHATELRDASSGKLRVALKGTIDKAESLALSRDSALLAIAGPKGVVQLWDAKTGKQLRQLATSFARTTALAFSYDRKLLAVASDKANVAFWNTLDGKLVNEWQGPGEPIMDLLFHPDGTMLILATQDGKAQLRDLKTAGTLLEIKSDEDGSAVTDVSLSADGRFLLVAGGKFLQMWDIPARSKLQTLSGHSDELFSSAFSPDGRFVVTGSGYLRASGAPPDDGNEIRVWDARTGREVLRYRSASMPVQHVSFGGDASTILAASMDGRIRHYRCEPCVPLAVLTQLAAKRSARGLTVEERRRYFPDSTLSRWMSRLSPP